MRLNKENPLISELERQLRTIPGYIERLEEDAKNSDGLNPADWRTGILTKRGVR